MVQPMKDKLHARCLIQANAKRVTELHDRIHDTFKLRDTSLEARAEWSQACDEFHHQYDVLAFPGGYEAGLRKIRDGDPRAIEDALAFLEVRPYFFRSQYIRTKLIRLLKHAQLSAQQVKRFQEALESDRKWKQGRATTP
jgi:hypothetical protein